MCNFLTSQVQKRVKTFDGKFECAFYGEAEGVDNRKNTLFCQQHKADEFNECDSSGLISWTLCIKGESHWCIRGSAQ